MSECAINKITPPFKPAHSAYPTRLQRYTSQHSAITPRRNTNIAADSNINSRCNSKWNITDHHNIFTIVTMTTSLSRHTLTQRRRRKQRETKWTKPTLVQIVIPTSSLPSKPPSIRAADTSQPSLDVQKSYTSSSPSTYNASLTQPYTDRTSINVHKASCTPVAKPVSEMDSAPAQTPD